MQLRGQGGMRRGPMLPRGGSRTPLGEMGCLGATAAAGGGSHRCVFRFIYCCKGGWCCAKAVGAEQCKLAPSAGVFGTGMQVSSSWMVQNLSPQATLPKTCGDGCMPVYQQAPRC